MGLAAGFCPKPRRIPAALRLIPNVTFVIRNLKPFQKPPKLFLERNRSMMFLLTTQVLPHAVNTGLTENAPYSFSH